ncbi:LysR family transcriptional regulator [Rhizobium laguerreae]|uniref:LysR family transcriptional regulator n=1 Tax=Rhizobium laguerreae TaxID=1076926 RepID=UPI00143F34C5|nr:LysR family transcriptional regulator [Rhizobium laguerreae]MBY3069448.1 LysR family transcriptional regulator [Rhizobium laguerreae]MBY3099704.1 LysR family transcriptional regulator [Rhizobium laguerreae]MBY3104270.1 LysR family transcriptional regulator [Rhizobium laguerreae]MBY3124366.1 LysR family transcriptional regulator [Rhizobium laguerreae]
MTSNHCADKTSKSTQLDKVCFAMDQLRLDSLDVFAAIVRCGGFRAAALERGVSSSALSQTINALEEALGIRLLNRTTRSVSPTEAGQRLLLRLGPALTDIRLAVDDLNQLKENPSGTLRINAPGPAIDHLLCPAMFTFMDTYPDIKVELISDAAVIDIVEQGFDAGVRFGKQLAQDMIAVPLGPSLRYAIVASPDYIAKHGLPLTPNDLAGHNCIRRRFPGGTLVSWKFEKGGDALEVLPEGRLTVSSAHNELQAAVAGCGLAHVFEDYATPDLTNGRLTEVLKDWSPLLPSWYLYYPSKRHSSAAMRELVSFLRSYDWKLSRMPA